MSVSVCASQKIMVIEGGLAAFVDFLLLSSRNALPYR
jgi:hypothetical protein